MVARATGGKPGDQENKEQTRLKKGWKKSENSILMH